MDPRCLDYLITDAEKEAFKRDGHFVLPEVLDDDQIARLTVAVDRVDAEYRKEIDAGPYARTNKLDFIGEDEVFLEFLNYYKTFPKVFGLMGWHIQL